MFKGGREKPDLPKALHERRTVYVQVWGRIRGPPFTMKKMNLGMVEIQFPTVLKGLLQFLLNRYSVTFSIPSAPQPTLFPISMQLWANYKTHIFKKWGTYQKTAWLDSRVKQSAGPRERYSPGLNLAVNGPGNNR